MFDEWPASTATRIAAIVDACQIKLRSSGLCSNVLDGRIDAGASCRWFATFNTTVARQRRTERN